MTRPSNSASAWPQSEAARLSARSIPREGTIAILLAAYNGKPWLAEQLKSILDQREAGSFVVLVRDDGSSDGSRELVAQYAAAHPRHIELLREDGRRLGACGSFAALLDVALADPRGFSAFMFCDQDDVWLAEKVAASRAALDALPSERPRLVHTDTQVVDAGLETIAPSFWAHHRMAPGSRDLRRLLLHSNVVGHTVLFDRALAELVAPIPAEAQMHDWWLALTAAAFAEVATLERPLSLYRQHAVNVAGCAERSAIRFLSIAHWRQRVLRAGLHHAVLRQADAWMRRYGDRLDANSAQGLERLRGFADAGWLGRRVKLLASGVRPRTTMDWAAFLMNC